MIYIENEIMGVLGFRGWSWVVREGCLDVRVWFFEWGFR